jgi:ribosomal protein S1
LFRAARSWKKPAPNSVPAESSEPREGQIIDGVVKNITDYGAFVDLGGIDGLLHVTDMSYKRVNHPKRSHQHR